MAVRGREEIMSTVKLLLGERDDDDALAVLEDFNDTLNDYDSRGQEDWKGKYEESERSWRQKYKERFFQTPGNGETDPAAVATDNSDDLQSESKAKSFDELFAESEANSGY